jgi:hypothetical protein
MQTQSGHIRFISSAGRFEDLHADYPCDLQGLLQGFPLLDDEITEVVLVTVAP